MQTTDLKELLILRPIAEYHDDMGDVLWWAVPIVEPPWLGTPNTCGQRLEIHTTPALHTEYGEPQDPRHVTTLFVGGWPGYHTHFSPLPMVAEPDQAIEITPQSL